jgi:hypothetical protein
VRVIYSLFYHRGIGRESLFPFFASVQWKREYFLFGCGKQSLFSVEKREIFGGTGLSE